MKIHEIINGLFELQDWHRVERDEDDGDITYHEYEFDFCPRCGCKVIKEL